MLATLTRPWMWFSLVMTLAMLLVPSVAGAASANYKGWATINQPQMGPSYCSLTCTADVRYHPIQAWTWTGTQWTACERPSMRPTTIPQYLGRCFTGGERVYAWPFGSGWHWVWTQSTGWAAVRSSDVREPSFEQRRCYEFNICPIAL